jgi:hypothetical protein
LPKNVPHICPPSPQFSDTYYCISATKYRKKFIFKGIVADDNDDEDSMQVLGDLETIDDDCDKHGIQFVKIDDDVAAKEFGIDDVPALVYFEKGIPNVYDGK